MTQQLQQILTSVTQQSIHIKQVRPVAGGSINESLHVATDQGDFFVKLNHVELQDMFAAEHEGLLAMAQTSSIRVPQSFAYGVEQTDAYIVMEYIELGSAKSSSATLLGEQLAAMHQHTQAQFGWYRHNTIGSTPQINTLESDWVTFFAEHRLLFQLQLAARHGFSGDLQQQGDRLVNGLKYFFTDYQPQASLLHGDLWSGNYAYDKNAQPVIFDPAVYYGDRETDLAMTELFGGFPADFYAAYNRAWPLDSGYQVRKHLYKLYHVLNHLNLFGGGYLSQAQQLLDRLLSELN
ncbi:MAG: fructosamine kinase family protein [Gammaproteobacteria bacterium]|nr:fructosamine kinase family protein [Gammaproteobacteria bacterium]